MASTVAEDHCNTETEEGTVALHKKRSRRVSFAEITSVHVFDRDDELETPPDPKPSSDNPELGQPNQGLGFQRDSTDGEDSKELSQNEEEDADDDDEFSARRLFLRPIESPSPGSTIGSATSNDEDNFFGPVSASFIRPGRLSDSAASDENHDITMDSTAFSMHFRSLARSDSGGDLKTPTGVHLSFEEKTPTQNTIPANLGSSMVLTVANKPISVSSTSVEKLSCNTDSNDMSLVGESLHRYDYGRLSPGLDALLAEGSKDLHPVSAADKSTISKSPINMKSWFSPSKKHSGPLGTNDRRDEEMCPTDTHDMLAEPVSFAHKKLGDANGGYKPSSICQIPYGFSSDMHTAPASDTFIDKQNWSPKQLTKGILASESKESDASEMRRNSDFYAVNCGTLSNLDNKVHQLDVFALRECESPLTGSMSSLSAKQRQIVLDSPSPSTYLQITTPSQKQRGSFVRDKIIKCDESISSIQKSISRLKMLEASPFSSTLKVNIDSTLTSSEYIFKTPPLNTVLDRNREDAQIKCVDASVACREDQLFIVSQEHGEQKQTIDMDGNDIDTSENIVDITHAKGSTGVAKVGMVVTSGTGSLLSQIPLDQKDKKATGTPQKSVPSPEKTMKKKSLASTEYWGNISRDFKPYDQDNKIKSVDPGDNGDLRVNVRNASLLTTVANKLDSLFMGRVQSSSPLIEINHSKESTGIGTMGAREINLHALQDESGAIGNFQTPLTDRDTKFHSIILEGNLQIGTDPVKVKDHTGGWIKASSCSSASPFIHRGENEPPRQKKLVELFTKSPSRNGLCNVTHNDRLHSVVVEDLLSPNTFQLRNGFENNSERKRRRGDMIPRESDRLEEISGIQRSPKLHRSEGCDLEFLSEHPNESNAEASTMGLLLEHPNETNTETSTGGRERRLEHWADVLSKFLADTKHLISPSIDKLNLQAIGMLEDVLVNLERSQKYEMLCTAIRSQKSFEILSNLHHKRVADAKLLLHRLVYEQAKLQLMRVKQARLLKKVQLLSSGIQESQMLKLNASPHLSVPCARDPHVDKIHCQSISYKGIHEEEVAGDKVTALRQVVDTSGRKIMSLTKSFHASCKMKGEPSSGDTILLVNDHLKKRACCRFIRLDLQLWEVDNLESTNGHHNMFLNYCGLIIQRLTINVGPVSSIVISNKLNDANILKIFPNMDVCTAFAYALNANAAQKYVGSRSLTEQTQITNSVLGNLLDVLEEVQVAHVELHNLTYTSFRSQSVGQLELHLHFINFKSGRKVALILDVSCLKWGIYPSEVIPSQLEVPADTSQKSLPEPLSAEIRAAVQNLRVGYTRIMRVCRSVSQAVQAWSG